LYRSLATHNAGIQASNGAASDYSQQPALNLLYGQGLMAPGMINIPVCSTEIAFAAWDTPGADTQPGYPCIGVLESDCEGYTYYGDSSCASPYIKDCQQMLQNFDQSGGHNIEIGHNVQIANYQTCALNVKGPAGKTFYSVGLQDIIDLVNNSINNGSLYNPDYPTQIGAGGSMVCSAQPQGTENVAWSIDLNQNWSDNPSCP
jgi:hypothetical protein